MAQPGVQIPPPAAAGFEEGKNGSGGGSDGGSGGGSPSSAGRALAKVALGRGGISEVVLEEVPLEEGDGTGRAAISLAANEAEGEEQYESKVDGGNERRRRGDARGGARGAAKSPPLYEQRTDEYASSPVVHHQLHQQKGFAAERSGSGASGSGSSSGSGSGGSRGGGKDEAALRAAYELAAQQRAAARVAKERMFRPSSANHIALIRRRRRRRRLKAI